MNRIHFAVVLALLIIGGSAAPAQETKPPIVIDGNSPGETFEGIGALSAGASSRLLIDYLEPQRGEILDFLFKPKFGAALQHLKVEIGGDVDSTDGSEPSIARTREEFTHPKPEYFQRGYEWWLMKEAKKRNPEIIFDILQWGAPGWIGEGRFYSQDNADFIAAFIKGAKKYHDLDIGYCGIWNEKPYDTRWIKLLRRTLDRDGLRGVKIVAADEVNRWSIADEMACDRELCDAVQVVGTHYPGCKSTPTAHSFHKPVWSSEDGPWSGNWSGTHSGCPGLAMAYNRNYIVGRMTATVVWSPITAYYDILPLPGSGLMRANQPWSGHYEVQPAVWITAHTTQFIAPGWKYAGGGACGLLPDGGSHVAAISPDGKNFSIVIETIDAKRSQQLSFALRGGLSCAALHAWRSNAKEQFVRLADIPVSAGTFTLNAEAGSIYSLTTTAGQHKGAATIPRSQPMPLPYREDFESYPLGATPKYLTDFFGAFEVAPRDGGGKCLRQVITRRGIAWCGDDEPVTIVGNPAWRDYEAACDVCLDSSQSARLYGRIMQVPHGNQSPTGYALCLGGDGAWQLRAGKKSLLSGKLSILPRSWHRMELRFRGERITVALDGRDAGSVDDATFGHGLVGLGCRYETVMFDNLAVTGRAAPTGLQPARTTSSSDWSEEYGAEMATDGDPSTRWNAAAGKGIGEWVELDFQRPIRFDSVRCSQFARRITRYRIEVADGDRFVEVFSGNTDQKDEFSARFKPATASKLRFVVLGIATDPAQAPPSLYEIEVFDRG